MLLNNNVTCCALSWPVQPKRHFTSAKLGAQAVLCLQRPHNLGMLCVLRLTSPLEEEHQDQFEVVSELDQAC